MLYFAYGSNLHILRIRARVPSAIPLTAARLPAHDLRFHKRGIDGSAKADACFTGNPGDAVHGVLFRVAAEEKLHLDRIEGVGYGYRDCRVEVELLPSPALPDSIVSGVAAGAAPRETLRVHAFTYCARASHIDARLRPYTWYKDFVVRGADQHDLCPRYIARIESVPAIRDPDLRRHAANARLLSPLPPAPSRRTSVSAGPLRMHGSSPFDPGK